jgi:murein L,D-transpeptidase YafK
MSTPIRTLLPTLVALATALGCGGPAPRVVENATKSRQPVAAAVAPITPLVVDHAPGASEVDHLGAKTRAVETKEPVEERLAAVQSELLGHCSEARTILIYKTARRLELLCGETVAGRYGVSLGFAPDGHKHHEGDGRTPEGDYFISTKYHSKFHRSLQVAYPNAADADRGLQEGQISAAQHRSIVGAFKGCRTPPQNTALGSYIQVHGGGGGPDYSDWTLGCVALENDAIEKAFAFHRPGCSPDGSPRTLLRILP